MYLKKLSLQGFKSFPRRTVFEFGTGVTAVVGPNGSGKSNVSDAIRWVLGEQSTKLLRAKKSEDVIFSGTSDRAQVGMAEVILTLDNADKWLPVEFAEVEIGRRVYRSGESEYLLNGSRVRLKDVVDLLMRGHVGQNSYTIMGQGLVDEVLSMGPDERRSFLDEAADVKRFRVKIKEARDRLKATRDNMTQVQYVIDEIEPRLEQLQRQADRANEHHRLSSRLTDLLKRYYTTRWADAQNEVVRRRATLDQRTAEHKEAEQRVAQVKEQVTVLNEEIRRRREAIARRDTRTSELEQQIAAAEQAISLDNERRQMATSRREEVEGELQALEEELAGMAPATPESDEAGAPYGQEVEQARAAVQECKQVLDRAEREYATLRARAQELRDGVDGDERRRGAAESEIAAAEKRIAELDQEYAQTADRRRQLVKDLKDYGRRFNDLLGAVEQAQDRLEAARDESEDARRRLERVQDEVRQYEQSVQAEQRELDRLEGRLDALQRVQTESEGVTTGTRNTLVMGQALIEGVEPGSMGEAPEINGVVGLLSRQIRVPAGLEAAINAALENRLHAIVVEHEDQAIKAIQLLHQRNHGRAQFLPLNSIRQVHPLNLQKETGVVGVASKLVKCEAACRPLIDTLLGRVIIVEDVQAGMRMIRRSLGSVVTRDGVYIEPTGVLTGGSIGNEEGEFARQRELDELPAQIEELGRRVQVSQKQLDNGRAAVDQMVRAAREADNRYDEIRKSGDDGRLDLERERERLYRIRREMDSLQARRNEIEREYDASERAIETARQTVQQLETRKAERQAALVDVEKELSQATEQRESALRALSDASGRLASVEGEQRAQEAMREQRQRAIEKVEARLEARREQIASADREAATIDERIASTQQRLEALHAEKAQFTDDAAPDRDELDRFENRERQVQEELDTAREEFFRIERARLDADAELSRAREQVETIRASMEREGLAPDRQGNVVPIDDAEAADDATTADEAAEEPASTSVSGSGDVDAEELRKEIDDIRRQIRKLGPINAEAPEDYRESKERYDFLTSQMADLTDAEVQLNQAIDELSGEIRTRFTATFEKVNTAFGEYFTAFFGGGQARLVLTDPENPSDSGIDIEAQPPGKRINSLALLSGGERSLTAVAMLFALLTVNPAPFCVLDEVDAALDEANVGRFTGSLRKLSEKTQFLAVTHNRRTVEAADAIYGISMGGQGVSKVLSLKLEDVQKDASSLGQ